MDVATVDDGGIYSTALASPSSDDFMDVRDLRRSRFGEVDRFEQLEHVGSGSNGSCILLKRRSDQTLRVCKTTKRVCNFRGDYENEPMEAKILLDILPTHDRISRLHEAIVQPTTVQLYFDYYAEGDLSTLIKRYRQYNEFVPEAFMWHAYLQLTEALAYLHTGLNHDTRCMGPVDWPAVIHGDIKPANIFLSPPDPSAQDPLCREYPSLVLGDFGLADLRPKPYVGTLKYQPPELPSMSVKADVWAVGGVMHTMAHFEAPVSDLPQNVPYSIDNLMKWYAKPEARHPLPLDSIYTLELHDVVFEAFLEDPRGRIDSLSLFCKVLDVFQTRIEPSLEYLFEPLIPRDYEVKLYDENGCTLNTMEIQKMKVLEAEVIEAMDNTDVVTDTENESDTLEPNGWYTPPETRSVSDPSNWYDACESPIRFAMPEDWSDSVLMSE